MMEDDAPNTTDGLTDDPGSGDGESERPLIEIDDLKVTYKTDKGDLYAVNGANLTIGEDDIVGLVGESGSGKTTLGKAILQLLDENGQIASGTITYDGQDLTELSVREMKKTIRWQEISLVPQHAMNGFDPVYTVGDQIEEVIQYHRRDVSDRKARERAEELFDLVGISSDRLDDYPHQFSGGMAQRGMIALALALNPNLIIADEPTTALDVLIQERIIDHLQRLLEEIEGSMLLITHDISVVGRTCDHIAVMYGGRVVEYGTVRDIVYSPKHPYTMGLQQSIPDITEEKDKELVSIPGQPPDLTEPKEACSFAPRCPFAVDKCWEETPQPETYGDGQIVECHRADEAEALMAEAEERETWAKMKKDHTSEMVGQET